MSYEEAILKAYKNGSLINSQTTTYTIPTLKSLIGKDWTNGSSVYFNEKIDEVKLFDRALSGEAIEALHDVE